MTKRHALVGKTKPKTGHFTKNQLVLLERVSLSSRMSQTEILRRLVETLVTPVVLKMIGAHKQKVS